MELSESVQRGLRSLAEPAVFDRAAFRALADASFRSLLSSHGDPSVLGETPVFVCAATSGPLPCVTREPDASATRCLHGSEPAFRAFGRRYVNNRS